MGYEHLLVYKYTKRMNAADTYMFIFIVVVKFFVNIANAEGPQL